MSRQKIILFIVEGTTDEDALSGILKKLFQNNLIKFAIVRSDITIAPGISTKNCKERINEVVKRYINTYKVNKNDICEIVHLVDTDGCYIDKSCVFKSPDAEKSYQLNGIYALDPEKMIQRNQLKSRILNSILGIRELTFDNNKVKIPYSLFYFACNLEHVLHDQPNALREDKEALADAFSDSYEGREADFLEFITNSDFAVSGNYRETWDFIQNDLHSLERHTNFGVYFRRNDKVCKE